jgi:ribosome-associated protein
MDVTGLSPVCDFFVLATGTSGRQMRSVADDIEELSEVRNFAPMSRSDTDSSTWILVDCVDVIVHIFSEDARHYYDLDNLWGDAKRVEWEN